jgi:hypothetical protein
LKSQQLYRVRKEVVGASAWKDEVQVCCHLFIKVFFKLHDKHLFVYSPVNGRTRITCTLLNASHFWSELKLKPFSSKCIRNLLWNFRAINAVPVSAAAKSPLDITATWDNPQISSMIYFHM